jgi:hypothetical protein
MKKLVCISAFILFSTIAAFSQVENVAKEVLNAYKNKDVELLKKNAPGILKPAISESYFEDEIGQEIEKRIAGWDGTIKEVRYEIEDLVIQKMVSATAYYADAGPDQIYTVNLSSLDNGKSWVFIGTGLGSLKKEEFERLSKTMSVEEDKKESRTAGNFLAKLAGGDSSNKTSEPETAGNFSAELANGDIYDKISEAKMVECINSLDDDNFFITLSNEEDFIQAAFSDGDFIVEYKENGKQFSAEKVLTKDETIQLFKDYYQGKDNWKNEIVWVDF